MCRKACGFESHLPHHRITRLQTRIDLSWRLGRISGFDPTFDPNQRLRPLEYRVHSVGSIGHENWKDSRINVSSCAH